MPHLQIHEMRIREKCFMHKHLVSAGGHTIREAEEKSTSTFRRSRLGESRCLISKFKKCEITKVPYAQAFVNRHGHIKEGASAEKLCFRVSKLVTWTLKMSHRRICELRMCETGK
jgi:hypothetical protein